MLRGGFGGLGGLGVKVRLGGSDGSGWSAPAMGVGSRDARVC